MRGRGALGVDKNLRRRREELTVSWMSREKVFAAIRKTTEQIAEKQELPDYDPGILVSAPKMEGDGLWDIFSRNFKAVNGQPLSEGAELHAILTAKDLRLGYCDPELVDFVREFLPEGEFALETVFDRERYDEYGFGITQASGGIAESGSLILDDLKTSDRLGALAPWVHVAVLNEGEILETIPEATEKFGSSPNTIWVTGPSKTADVEGILIEGVHGPGEQVALLRR